MGWGEESKTWLLLQEGRGGGRRRVFRGGRERGGKLRDKRGGGRKTEVGQVSGELGKSEKREKEEGDTCMMVDPV